MKNYSFISFDWKNGELFRADPLLCMLTPHTKEAQRIMRSCVLHALVGANTFTFNSTSSYYIYQYAGLSYINGVFPVLRSFYAAVSGEQGVFINGDAACQAIIIEYIDPALPVPFSLGGPIEEKGRLKYIDGCTDSLLIAPWKKGEACLNHLHFPAAINQTPHTHPTIRIGVVARGSGECITPFGNQPLKEGMIFAILPENGLKGTGEDGNEHLYGTHSFRTTTSTMDVIAFHPDSDFGPEDENHPMINRTIVDGVSANQIQEIQTK